MEPRSNAAQNFRPLLARQAPAAEALRYEQLDCGLKARHAEWHGSVCRRDCREGRVELMDPVPEAEGSRVIVT